MRLLTCQLCKTVEEIPDFGGDLAENEPDPLVEEIVRQHNVRDPMGHGGRDIPYSPMRLAHVDNEAYRKDKKGVLDRLREENKRVGFDAWAYEALNTYEEDAMRCYNDHHRPTQGCIDWRSDSKRIGRPTEEGKKFRRENYKIGLKDPHLCDFCVVKSFVQTEINWKRGLYKG